jgi:hypothetical protein
MLKYSPAEQLAEQSTVEKDRSVNVNGRHRSHGPPPASGGKSRCKASLQSALSQRECLRGTHVAVALTPARRARVLPPIASGVGSQGEGTHVQGVSDAGGREGVAGRCRQRAQQGPACRADPEDLARGRGRLARRRQGRPADRAQPERAAVQAVGDPHVRERLGALRAPRPGRAPPLRCEPR